MKHYSHTSYSTPLHVPIFPGNHNYPSTSMHFLQYMPRILSCQELCMQNSPHHIRGIANKQAQCVDNEVVTVSSTYEMAA